MKKLIIFDCDGVLIDSEMIYHKVGAEELTQIGFPMTFEKSIQLFTGKGEEFFAELLFKEYGKVISDVDSKMILKKVKDSFKASLQPVVNILKVIDYVKKQDIARCIASNSTYDYIVNALSLVKMEDFFDRKYIFSASMVAQKKPAPDVFLLAAEQMGCKVNDCLVVEDSAVGIQAALAANMQVIGFLGGAHAKNNWYQECITGYNIPIAYNSDELLHRLQEWIPVGTGIETVATDHI